MCACVCVVVMASWVAERIMDRFPALLQPGVVARKNSSGVSVRSGRGGVVAGHYTQGNNHAPGSVLPKRMNACPTPPRRLVCSYLSAPASPALGRAAAAQPVVTGLLLLPRRLRVLPDQQQQRLLQQLHLHLHRQLLAAACALAR